MGVYKGSTKGVQRGYKWGTKGVQRGAKRVQRRGIIIYKEGGSTKGEYHGVKGVNRNFWMLSYDYKVKINLFKRREQQDFRTCLF